MHTNEIKSVVRKGSVMEMQESACDSDVNDSAMGKGCGCVVVLVIGVFMLFVLGFELMVFFSAVGGLFWAIFMLIVFLFGKK